MNRTFNPRVRKFANAYRVLHLSYTAERLSRIADYLAQQPDVGCRPLGEALGSILAEHGQYYLPDRMYQRTPQPQQEDVTMVLPNVRRAILAELSIIRVEVVRSVITFPSFLLTPHVERRNDSVYDYHGRLIAKASTEKHAEVIRKHFGQILPHPEEELAVIEKNMKLGIYPKPAGENLDIVI